MSVTTEGFRTLASGRSNWRMNCVTAACLFSRKVATACSTCRSAHIAVIEAIAGLPPSWDTDPLELDVPTRLGEAERTAVDAAAATAGL